MNSTEGYKGFLTFLILAGIVLTALVGFRYIQKPTNTTSQADIEKLTATDVVATDITASSAKISWKTESDTLGGVSVSLFNTPCAPENTQCATLDATEGLAKDHSVVLNALDAGATYYYQIRIDGQLFPEKTLFSFTTKSVENQPSPVEPLRTVEPEFQGIMPSQTAPSLPVVPATPQPTTQLPAKSTAAIGGPVLGAQDSKLIDDLLAKEFEQAMKYNDSKYDFNKDGTVTVLDYPLFVEFTRNPED